MTLPRSNPAVWLAGLLLGAVLTACDGGSEPGVAAGAAPPAPAAAPAAVAPPAPPVPSDEVARALAETLKRTDWAPHVESALATFPKSREAMARLVRRVYAERGGKPVFLDALWPAAGAAELVRAVREVPAHGLPHSPYCPGVLFPLHDRLALDPAAGQGSLTRPADDLERLSDLEWQYVRSIYKTARKEERVREVVCPGPPAAPATAPPALDAPARCLLEQAAAALRSPPGEPFAAVLAKRCPPESASPAAHEAALAAVRGRGEQLAALAQLDAWLVQAFFQWVLDFRIDYRVHPFLGNGPATRARLPEEQADALLKALTPVGAGAPLGDTLRAMVPGTPAYGHARAALVRYVRLADAEPAPPALAPGFRAKAGDSGPGVEALQRRLAAEGFFSEAPSGTFGDATRAAVEAYQRTHGVDPTGTVGARTVESLNTPFSWRVRQLLVALGRLRESPLARKGTPDFFLRVNLPAFALDVFEKGAVVRTQKVIVGSNALVKDPLNGDTLWHQRRSKIFETEVTEVIIHPTWIVPELIRLQEVTPKKEADAEYYAKNNFREVGRLLVQGPGPTNPLGKVKLNLAATDAIYLHDTDKPWLFKEHPRDFSHGCIRVEQALDFAKFLLERQGTAAEEVDRRVAAGATYPIAMKPPVPIYIEYNTVDFTPSGEPIFYADLYEFDTWYWKKRTPIVRRLP